MYSFEDAVLRWADGGRSVMATSEEIEASGVSRRTYYRLWNKARIDLGIPRQPSEEIEALALLLDFHWEDIERVVRTLLDEDGVIHETRSEVAAIERATLAAIKERDWELEDLLLEMEDLRSRLMTRKAVRR